MCRVVLLICALYIARLPTGGITQQITAEQFQLLVEERVKKLSLTAESAYLNIIENVTGIMVEFSLSRDYTHHCR